LLALVPLAACAGEVSPPPGLAGLPDDTVTAPDAAVPDDGGGDASAHPSLPSTFDDRFTTLKTEADVANERRALIRAIWGSDALPTSLPIATQKTSDEVGAAIPANLTNLDTAHVWQLDFPTMNPMPPNGTDGGTGMAFLLTPLQAPRHRVVVLSTGHLNTFDMPEDGAGTGVRNVVQTLLTENYSVLLVYMAHFTPSDNTGAAEGPGDHDRMFADGVYGGSREDPVDAAPYRYFVEPTILAINYLASGAAPGGAFTDIAVAGLSGGAWTTVMIAALDTRPRLSVAVAAGLPGYIEDFWTMDGEQFVRSRLGVGYADLHVMGAVGTALDGSPRRQTHVLNRRDTCCFSEIYYDDHDGGAGTWQSSVRLLESNVRAALFGMGSAGRYRLEVDEMADHHMVSANSLHNIMLAELDDDRKLVGAANSNGDMFYRGVNGNLWRRTFPIGGGSTEADTGVAIAGVASVAEGGPNAIDVFARDSKTGGGVDNLVHYYLPQGQTTWVRETLPAFTMSDPGVVASGGTFDVVTLGIDGSLQHLAPGATTLEPMSASVFVGPPAVVRFQGALHVFARGKDLSVYHFTQAAASAGVAAPWIAQPLTTVMSGFPAAAPCGDLLCVATLGPDSAAAVGTIDASGAWSGWSSLSATGPLKGTPSLAATGMAPTGTSSTGTGTPPPGPTGGNIPLYVSTDHGTLGRFTRPMQGGAWTFVDLPDATVASPTAIQATGGAVISGGQSGALWIHRGTTSTLGGWFD
jgi:hypothetical protein